MEWMDVEDVVFISVFFLKRGRGCCAKKGISDANLVVAAGGDVADPREGLVVAALDDLEIPHLDARDGKVRNLELDADGRTILRCLLCCCHYHSREKKRKGE